MKEDICRKAPHSSTEEGYKYELTWFLTRILEDRENQRNFITKDGLEKQFNETLFPYSYKIYEDYLYNPSPKDYLICPINNLTSSRPIDLQEWQIRKISDNEFSNLVEAHNKQDVRLEVFPEFIICLHYDNNWQGNLRKMLSALRLLKQEKISLKYVYRAYQFPFHTWQVINAPEGTKTAGEILHTPSNIEPEEELKSLWTTLNGIGETNYIITALRRFNFAYERERIEDAWVDYFIALESLFLKESGETFELIHRLSNRISKVLGEDTFSDRKKIKEKITDWYNVRSRIVHGAPLKPKEMSQIDELKDKVSACIKWFINNANREDHNRILDLLDLMH